ncbi:MAG: large conductance mechanosensitive channel protein MscL [Bacillota bacterium]|nr:large conductance mechanosensitive channel protein MscL [Bacillota bacterium]
MIKEFKEFISKGNVMDMAIGVIIGGAFGKIVSSLVADVLMPLIGLATGGVNFSDKFVNLSGTDYQTLAQAEEAGAAVLKYGAFIQAIFDFLIISFVIFLVIKQINRFKKEEVVEEEAPTTKVCPFCKTDIPIEATRCPHCTSELN